MRLRNHCKILTKTYFIRFNKSCEQHLKSLQINNRNYSNRECHIETIETPTRHQEPQIIHSEGFCSISEHVRTCPIYNLQYGHASTVTCSDVMSAQKLNGAAKKRCRIVTETRSSSKHFLIRFYSPKLSTSQYTSNIPRDQKFQPPKTPH